MFCMNFTIWVTYFDKANNWKDHDTAVRTIFMKIDGTVWGQNYLLWLRCCFCGLEELIQCAVGVMEQLSTPLHLITCALLFTERSDGAGRRLLLFTLCVKSRCLFCFSRHSSSAWPATSCWTRSTTATSALQLTVMRTHMHTNMESFWLALHWGWGGAYSIINKQQKVFLLEVYHLFSSSDILYFGAVLSVGCCRVRRHKVAATVAERRISPMMMVQALSSPISFFSVTRSGTELSFFFFFFLPSAALPFGPSMSAWPGPLRSGPRFPPASQSQRSRPLLTPLSCILKGLRLRNNLRLSGVEC